jgi:peptidoglycan/xylan/chitin deacetylase (PgdA/CDA1 family)
VFRSLAKLAVKLDLDNAANRILERRYTTGPEAKPARSRRFQILAYHKVSADPHPFFEPVHPAVFDQQMWFLKRCYRVMDLMELVDRSRRGDVPDRAVAITFDDGYGDNYDNAFPILKKYQLPATIFVATGVIGTDQALWHDRVFDSFRFTTRRRARLKTTEVPELVLQTAEARHRSLTLVLNVAKKMFGETRKKFVDEVESALEPDLSGLARHRMLSWKQVREMHRAGIAFGSHTVSHTVVTRIPREKLVEELQVSKRQLSEHLGAPVRAFAYPNGHATDYNSDVKAAVKDCGYDCAVTAEPGFNDAFSDPYELKRGQPWHKEIELFRLAFLLQRHGLRA